MNLTHEAVAAENAMPGPTFRGVFPILVMPFDETMRVDEESLRRLVEFNLEAGVHGLGVALGSEIFRLTEAERQHVTRIVVDQTRGRVPVVINTGAQGTEIALHWSRLAEEAGADALMIMPPSFVPAGPVAIRDYFRSISDAVRIPIFIQDTDNPRVPPELAVQIAGESEQVRYVKVECNPPAEKVAEAVAAAGKHLVIFGGAAGNALLEELRAGSQGTMPSCCQPEAFVAVWERFHAGDESGAREAFETKIAPVNRLAMRGWSALYYVNKEILRRRGVIRSTSVRGPIDPLDDATWRELETLIGELYAEETRR
jgi:4-hydroxy-tetrahydrodipicolinate synthase